MSMELGNALFGNSRGKYEVPRELANSNEWIELMHQLIQVEDYHCCIGEYYEDYTSDDFEVKKRTSPIKVDKYGGCTLEVNGKIIFKLFPYWWGDCTCDADEKNNKLEKQWKKELFTPYQWKTYMTFEDWCEDDCPAYPWSNENKNKTVDELLKKCTCGTVKKNIRLQKRKDKLKDKIKEFERRENECYIAHKSDCKLLEHNFVYHPGENDEFYIEWYKYPFRDSYMNKDLNLEEIKNILRDCIKEFKNKYKLV